MELEKKIESCAVCNKCDFTAEQGVLCGMTKAKPQFDPSCNDYAPNRMRLDLRNDLKKRQIGSEEDSALDGALWIFGWLLFGTLCVLIGYLATYAPVSFIEFTLVVIEAISVALFNPISLFIISLGFFAWKKGDLLAYLCAWGLLIILSIIGLVSLLLLYGKSLDSIMAVAVVGAALVLSMFVCCGELYYHDFGHRLKCELKSVWSGWRTTYMILTFLIIIAEVGFLVASYIIPDFGI